VIFASGLKYVGLGTTALGWALCVTLLVIAIVWLAASRPWQRQAGTEAPAAGASVPPREAVESE
jgi:hypothetical protein